MEEVKKDHSSLEYQARAEIIGILVKFEMTIEEAAHTLDGAKQDLQCARLTKSNPNVEALL